MAMNLRLTISSWMGTQPTLKEKSGRVGITEVMPSAEIMNYLHKAVRKGQTVHYLPPYRAEHKLKLMEWLGIPPARQEGSVPFIRAIVAQRSYKSAEEVEEIEKACNVTADMHITAMKVLRPGMYEYEVVAEMNRVAESNNCELSFATIATVNGQTLHNHYHGNKVKPGDLFLIDAGAEVESGYAGDMSSTVPADKTFTPRQRAVYEIQNAMHLEAVKALCPGIPLYGCLRPFRPRNGRGNERTRFDERQCRRCCTRRRTCLVLSSWIGAYDGAGCA